MKQNGLIKNTVILFFSMAITKVLGAVLKIPLANLLGGIGMGYFSTSYSLFSPIYSFLSAGIPIVVTKMIAQSIVRNRFSYARAVKGCTLRISLVTGIVGSVAVFALAAPFSTYIAGSNESLISIMAIAPSVLFCCVAAAYKGYYEGLSNMTPTGVSQIVESVVKAVLGLLFANLVIAFLSGSGKTETEIVPYAAAGAIFGITIGELFGTFYLIARDKIRGDGITKMDIMLSQDTTQKKKIYRQILLEAVPISINAIVININSFLDLMTIANGITACVIQNEAYFRERYGAEVFSSVSPENFGTFVYGSYTGITLTLFMVISSMTALIGKSALPKIAAMWQRNNRDEIVQCVRKLFWAIFSLGIPLCAALGTFAEPILRILYSTRHAEVEICIKSLEIICWGGISISVIGCFFAIFQAIGRSFVPVRIMLLIAGLKLGGNLVLINIPEYSVDAAAISTVASHGVAVILAVIALNKAVGCKLTLLKEFFPPVICAVISAFVGKGTIKTVDLSSPLVSLGISLAAFSAVYSVLMLVFYRKKFAAFMKRIIKRVEKKKKIV